MASPHTHIVRQGDDASLADLDVTGDLTVTGDINVTGEMNVTDAEGLQLIDDAGLKFGTSEDVTITWDGTDMDMLPLADDSVFNIGDGTTSMDVKIFGETASDFLLWDASESNLEVTGDARLDFSGATVLAGNTDGGIIKAGTSGAPVTEDTADMKFMAFYFDNGATSGDNRGMYLRQYLTGAGGGGEAARIFTTISDVAAGTAHGAHISLNFGSSGSCTGQGIAMRGTLHIPDAAMSGGTYAAVQAEIYADGSSSDISGTTSHAAFRCVIGGDGTGAGTVANFLSISAPTPASNAFIDTDEGGGAAYAGLAVNIEGVGVKYIPLLSAA